METKETLYEEYAREICKECNNKGNDKDLCEIRVTIDNTAKCMNYERCMKTQCNRCKNERECFKS